MSDEYTPEEWRNARRGNTAKDDSGDKKANKADDPRRDDHHKRDKT